MTFARPETLLDALLLLSQSHWQILAGGTDFYPSLQDGPVRGPVLDITALRDLRAIAEDDDYWRIGAIATWSDLLATTLPSAFDGLKQAAREVGSVQIQNRATIVGNLCNASPAADGVPPLLTLDAKVRLQSLNGARDVNLAQFITGNRSTTRNADELVTAILIPKQSCLGQSSFLKLGARRYLVISIVMTACRLVADKSNKIVSAALSVGACSAVPRRLLGLENRLIGAQLSDDLGCMVEAADLKDLSPIDDMRATAHYRLSATQELVGRALVLAAKDVAQ